MSIKEKFFCSWFIPNRCFATCRVGKNSGQLSLLSSATIFSCLYRWTFYSSVTAINATVALFWFQNCFTFFALVKIVTSISRHNFFFLVSAIWTSDFTFKVYCHAVNNFASVAPAVKFVSSVIPNCRREKSRHTCIQKVNPMIAVIEMIPIENQKSAGNCNQQRISATMPAIRNVKSDNRN